MGTVSAFKEGSTALRANPVLLVAGFLLAIGGQLQNAGGLVESPVTSAGISLVWLLVFPFVLGGFIGVARAAIREGTTSFGQFLSAGKTYYVRMLLGMLLFVLLVLGVAVGVGVFSFAIGIGAIALGAFSETAFLVTAVGSMVVWLLLILVVILFVQFYDTAIVIENAGVTDAFRRSVYLVRSNLKSVVGFSLLWVVLMNVFLIPEYLVQLTLTDGRPAEVLPIDPGIPVTILIPVGIALSAIGSAYFYTVYTAYYVELIEESPT